MEAMQQLEIKKMLENFADVGNKRITLCTYECPQS